MRSVKIALISMLLTNFPLWAQAESQTQTRAYLSPEFFLGLHNSVAGGGVGLSHSLNDRWAIGVKWLSGTMDETETFKEFDKTRIEFLSADAASEELSVYSRYRLLESLSITAGIGQRKYSSQLTVYDRELILRRSSIETEATSTNVYIGIGNYWQGSWYRVGADWIGFSIPVQSKSRSDSGNKEPSVNGITFAGANPTFYYRKVDALAKRSRSHATATSYTFLLGNFTVLL